jgi:uncharacterized protein (DUF427 family)
VGYPRPPRIEPTSKRAVVIYRGETIADSTDALRVLETSGPPTIYIPPDDVRTDLLDPGERVTVCEWKGLAGYFDVVVGDDRAREAAWSYAHPNEGYVELEGYLAFYPGRVDACYLGGETVTPQPGRYYGGWITRDIVGPFKGERGTEGW